MPNQMAVQTTSQGCFILLLILYMRKREHFRLTAQPALLKTNKQNHQGTDILTGRHSIPQQSSKGPKVFQHPAMNSLYPWPLGPTIED